MKAVVSQVACPPRFDLSQATTQTMGCRLISHHEERFKLRNSGGTGRFQKAHKAVQFPKKVHTIGSDPSDPGNRVPSDPSNAKVPSGTHRWLQRRVSYQVRLKPVHPEYMLR